MRLMTPMHSILIVITQLQFAKSEINDAMDAGFDIMPGAGPILKLMVKAVSLIAEKEMPSSEDEILEQQKQINTKLSQLERKYDEQGLVLRNTIIDQTKNREMKDLYMIISGLKTQYTDLVNCFSEINACTSETKNDFIRKYTGLGYNDVKDQLKRLPDLLTAPNLVEGTKYYALFDYMILSYDLQKELHKDCGMSRQLYTQIWDLYNIIVEVMILSYVGIRTAFYARDKHLLFPNGIKNAAYVQTWNSEWRILINSFQNQLERISNTTKAPLATASRVLYNCDPNQWTNSGDAKNYLQLSHFMNGYLAAQTVLSSGHGCFNAWCKDYENTTYYPYKGYPNELACKGRIYDCRKSMATDVSVNTNFDNGEMPRYNYMSELLVSGQSHTDEKVYGTENTYSAARTFYPLRTLNPHTGADMWNIPNCDLCYCICDNTEHPFTVRILADGILRSDVSGGYVIYGLKFVRIKNGIGIAILQGKLVNGLIDTTTLNEKRPDYFLEATENNTVTYDSKCVYTDDLQGSPEYVLTGIGFIKRRNCHGLQIVVTKLDIDGNTVYPSHAFHLLTFWQDRTELEIASAQESSKSPNPNRIKSKPFEQYVRFQLTDLDKTAAQFVIPYFDAQIVKTNPPAPIGGVGLFYKGDPGYGGFLGLSIFSVTYDEPFKSEIIRDSLDEFYYATKI